MTKLSAEKQCANDMWGGRFSEGPSSIMEEINVSIDFDQRLAMQDIDGSLAHVHMLAAQAIISAQDCAAIVSGLETIRSEITSGTFAFSHRHEDIHMNIEARLAELIGPVAGRLHTARSRNDQVATDFRLWVRNACERSDRQIRNFQEVLIRRAGEHAATLMPGFTHLQSAQPVSFGHHLLAWCEMLGRDRSRMRDAHIRMNECPLGAAALAGTPWPIDRDATSTALGFRAPMVNSLDAVSDRDFALDYLAAASVCAVHLSRMAEELVIWSTPQFGFIRLSDGFSTGSSIMPQKRNPDAAELVRAKSGRIFGDLIGLLTVLKGLPLAYSKDMQEDKTPIFDAADSLELCLAAMTGMVDSLDVQIEAMSKAAAYGFPTATDLADHVVSTLGKPFREAHHIAGEAVKRAEELGVDLADLSLEDLQDIEAGLGEDARNCLQLEASLSARRSFGGTAPDRVREAVVTAQKIYLEEDIWLTSL